MSSSSLNSTKRKIRSPKVQLNVSNNNSLKEICKLLSYLTTEQQKYVSDFLVKDHDFKDAFKYDKNMSLIILYRDKFNYSNIKKLKEKIDKSKNLTDQIDEKNGNIIFKIMDKQDELMVNHLEKNEDDKENIKNHIKKENEIKTELNDFQDNKLVCKSINDKVSKPAFDYKSLNNDNLISKSAFKILNKKKLDQIAINDFSTTTALSFATNKSLCNITADNDYLLLPDSNSTANYFDIDLVSNESDIKLNNLDISKSNESQLEQSKIDLELEKYYQLLTKDDLLNLLKSKNNRLDELEIEIKNQQVQIDNLKSNCTKMKEKLNDNDNLIKNKDNEFKRLEIKLKYAEDTIDLERKTKDLYYKELCKLDKYDNDLKCAECSINKIIEINDKNLNTPFKPTKHFLEDDPIMSQLIKSKKRRRCD